MESQIFDVNEYTKVRKQWLTAFFVSNIVSFLVLIINFAIGSIFFLYKDSLPFYLKHLIQPLVTQVFLRGLPITAPIKSMEQSGYYG